MEPDFRNWSDLKVFLAVVRAGSTLAASKTLGMAQPTVARRIEALEHDCGLTLFDRDTRGFRLTEAARCLVPLAEDVESAARTFAERAREMTRPRPIRITAFAANFSPRAARIFSEFTARHPGIQFEFLPGTHILDLSKGEADIALRLTIAPPAPELVQRKISTAQFTLYGSKSYADRYGLPDSPEALAGHRFVTFRREGATTELHNWIAARVAPGQIVSTVQEIELMVASIKAGDALGLDNVRKNLDDPELIPCFEPPPELNRDQLMLITPEAYRRPEVRAFTKFFAPRYAALYK